MPQMLERLDRRARRGSKPRCHRFTNGAPEQVAARLTSLIAPWGVVSPADRWMPEGFDECTEAELDKADRLLALDIRKTLAAWWLPSNQTGDRTPNFDIASTCTIEGRSGLLLVEAKAYDGELIKAAAGRAVGSRAERAASQGTISSAIADARAGLSAGTGKPWRLSLESHYQLANRFAWSWKLAEQGVPVVLVYLGFIACHEMSDQGKPFATHTEWVELVTRHSEGIVPDGTWDARHLVAGVPLIPLIKSLECRYDAPYRDAAE